MHIIRHHFQHYFNPLHVFCRLRQIGLQAHAARWFCCTYERYLYRAIMN